MRPLSKVTEGVEARRAEQTGQEHVSLKGNFGVVSSMQSTSDAPDPDDEVDPSDKRPKWQQNMQGKYSSKRYASEKERK